MPRRLSLLLMLPLMLSTAPAYAQTQVIGFEGLPFGVLPQGYAGMQWSTAPFNFWYAITATSDPGANARYRPANGTANAYGDETAAISMWTLDGTFNLNYVFLSAVTHNLTCTTGYGVSASKGGVNKYTLNLAPLCGTPALERYDLNWLDVDRVTFSANSQTGVLVDDISITTTPEPGTLLLAATGLSGVLGTARRRRARR